MTWSTKPLLNNFKTGVGLNLRIDNEGDIGSDSVSDSSVDDEAGLLDVVNYSLERWWWKGGG